MSSILQSSPIDLPIFYKKEGLPQIDVGDKVKVTLYLELPKDVEEGQKKEERIQAFEGVVVSKHLEQSKIESTITVRKMFQGGGTERYSY